MSIEDESREIAYRLVKSFENVLKDPSKGMGVFYRVI
jgi:hypothetical protein